MNFAVAEPTATRKPIPKGSTALINAALEAISKLDGPAKGIRFSAKELAKIARSSNSEANISLAYSLVRYRTVDSSYQI